jgi:tetratricopeptide (TPR) repeat protein
LGVVYIKMERYRDAIEQFKTSLLIAPSVPGHSNLGTAYYYAGLYDDAVEEYRKTTQDGGANYRSWGNLADACRWAGREDEAAADYKTAINLLKMDTQMNPALQHATLAMYYVSMRHQGLLSIDDREQARKEIAAAAKDAERPGSPQAEIAFRQVVVYAQTGDLGQAFDALARLKKIAPASLREIEKTPVLKEFRQDRRYSRVLSN